MRKAVGNPTAFLLIRFTVKRNLSVVQYRRCCQHMIEPFLFLAFLGRIAQRPGHNESKDARREKNPGERFISITACSFFLQKSNSKAGENIFDLNHPISYPTENSFVIIKRIMALFNHLQRTKDQ